MTSFASTAQREANQDFEAICNHYKPFPYLKSFDGAKELLKMSHRFALSLAQLSDGSKDRPEHQRIFLQEMASDSIHLLHSLFLGDCRAAHFYMRSIVENFWRHIYFCTHPTEYIWLHDRPGFFLTIESLRDHCRYIPLAKGSLKARMSNLSNFFSETSGVVHSTNAPGLVLRASISAIVLSNADVKAVKKLLANLSKDILVLISVQEFALFDLMTSSRRAFFLAFLDKSRKAQRQSAIGTA